MRDSTAQSQSQFTVSCVTPLFSPYFGRQWITLKTIWLIRSNISIYSELGHPFNFPYFGRQWITLKTIWLIRWNISIYSELRHPLFPPYFGRQWISLRMIWLIRSNISIYRELSFITLIFSILWWPMNHFEDDLVN